MPVHADVSPWLRPATMRDMASVRQLPVALMRETLLYPRKYRSMHGDENCRLQVIAPEGRPLVFAALQFSPARASAIHFLVWRYFLSERQGLRSGQIVAMFRYAEQLARDSGSSGLIVRADKTQAGALELFTDQGYIAEGGMLIKKLSRSSG